MELSVNFSQNMGKIKPLSGVNSGPVSFGGLFDLSESFQNAGFDLIRLHDINYPYPREVDYYTIFPDFSKDPSNPASYDFEYTDLYIKQCEKLDADIIFRLGVSIEHSEIKRYVYPPKDLGKFADICLGIVRHYTEGWAGGFVARKIKYWEIWNEPDLPPCGPQNLSPTWNGTFDEFALLYEKVSTRLKAYNSSLKIGGCAFAFANDPFIVKFLDYVRRKNLPLDFCSWHKYSSSPLKVLDDARKVESLLLERGFTTTECFLDEWNYVPQGVNLFSLFRPGFENMATEANRRIQGEEGAAFAAAVWIVCQNAPVDRAAFFCACQTNCLSLFTFFGQPQKVYYAFSHAKIFKGMEVCDIQISESGKGLYTLTAKSADGKRGAVILANYFGITDRYSIALPPGAQPVKLFRTDSGNNFMFENDFSGGVLNLVLTENCVITIEFRM